MLGLLALLWVVVCPCSVQAAGERGENGITVEIDRLVTNGGLALAEEGRVFCSRNIDKPLVPASILKIVTGLGAAHILGEDFRFRTIFYLDQESNIFIKGLGDPFLISEEVALVVDRLRKKGLSLVHDIVLDDSAFQISGPPDGANGSDNPYDAENGALAVNFNTVNIRVEQNGAVSSAEPQTPALPIMTELAAGLGSGIHRINISRKDAGTGPDPVLIHSGQLFKNILAQKGVAVDGVIRRASVSEGQEPFYTHYSRKSLKDILGPLLLYSNNFIANQLFLVCGAEKYGYPATWEKGRFAFRDFLQNEMGLADLQVHMAEGSGLSRKNRLTPRAMLAVLDKFKPYRHLMPEKGGHLVKSGTLTGVYSYAGYLKNANRFDSFVIILNQPRNNRDKILHLLERGLVDFSR